MTASHDDGDLLYFSGHGRDILITSPGGEEEPRLITRDQLKLFVSYSHALRNKAAGARPPSPLGYEFFADAFNSKGLASSASYVDELGSVVSIGSAIELNNILGEEDDPEITLSTARMAQVEKMVWHTALNASHQRERMDARRANQQRERNYGRKQEQKLSKKGLGKVKKGTYLRHSDPLAGSSTTEATPEDQMAETD
ncbi:hypothetical protein BD769DRAFT_1386348 [Suillus cothurnatus]|nr:hypothetical protein BD769DRAFT_1386348 [Suillus cothurnatus]